MEYILKNNVNIDKLPGRGITRVVGKNSCFESGIMTVGYALYSKEYGVMEPHSHAEETVVVIKAIKGYVSWGDTKDNLINTMKLEEGMILHIPESEWHSFHYEEEGMIEIIFIYGSIDDCRPEDE